jgi:hypothetical protein
MRVQDHRNRRTWTRRRRETGFKTALGAGDGDGWHVVFDS